ncbi:hypothetical protein CWE09_05890 [Aliidiomarina minuta]|uniref:Uncharacterized protein n=1 Tax=Aliidiomarina minuta TaxID=880057 RepID=A0A432W854_9GAMM|nr:hypothetical protein [Aliidiomarina minuta]RUO26245.1 hypothetical protein CWE09_05890 [Aliidiomarina minuta]
MKKIMIMTALAALAMSSSALAGERVINDSRLQQAEASTQNLQAREAVAGERALEVRQALNARMEQGDFDRSALPKVSHRDLRVETLAARGDQSEAPRTITVLANNVSVSDVAREFGLSVVYQDQSTGVGVLDTAGHEDILALVQQLRSSDLVRAARPSRTEREFELHIAR